MVHATCQNVLLCRAQYCFLGSKITVLGDGSHEIRRHLLLGRKAMTNLGSMLQSRDMADKGLFSQSYGFSSSWIIKKAERQRVDAFKL